ncbi:DUF4376 domain-containing protein [Martelella mediterranea]|uniref:Uncharacterized protein DUF4376 n=1 Tax=Martelella mediterranea TaxID=293089 RepID=A0A4R3NFA2_9HYPH|nr:DUF4376 domain-containing protein [Martelella mediterranea]TCT28154.1 uncharacterized protein DUF4376 [Martelella mediterranea]
MSDPTKMVIDGNRVGTKGYPRHWQAIGAEPPMKYEESGEPINPVPENPTPDDLAAYAARISWETRVAGPLINGVRIKCDGDAIGLIKSMSDLAKSDGTRTFAFDTHGDGGNLLQLTASEAIALDHQVAEWVQKTFDRRAEVYAAITAGTVTTTADVDAAFADVTDDWPA